MPKPPRGLFSSGVAASLCFLSGANLQGGPPGSLRFRTWTGTDVVAERYVAIYSGAQAGEGPVFEALIPAGGVAPEFSLGPGDYLVDCGAIGYMMQFGRKLQISADGSSLFVCSLVPVATFQGVVRDPEGGKIAGAEVCPSRVSEWKRGSGHTRAFLDFASRTYCAQTDVAGRFSIAGDHGQRARLRIEAPLHVPKTIDPFSFPADSTAIPEVVLRHGGALRVELGPRQSGSQRRRVALRPCVVAGVKAAGENGEGDFSFEFSEDDENGVSINGLAVGEYDVLVFSPGWGSASIDAVQKSRATVELGKTATIHVPGGISVAGPGGLPPSVWNLHLLAGPRPADAPVRVFCERGGVLEEVRHFTTGVEGDVWVVHLAEELGKDPIVLAQGSSISRPFLLVDEKAKDLAVTLHPGCRVKVRLSPPAPDLSHHAVWLSVLRGTWPSVVVEGPYPAALDDTGLLEGVLPSDAVDVLATVDGFLALSWPGQRLPAGGSVELASRPLEPGGNALVRVVDPAGGVPVAGARVFAFRMDEREKVMEFLRGAALARTPLVCTTDTRGWCEVRGVPAGAGFLLGLAGGFAPTVGERFAVEPALRTTLDDLRLQRTGTLEVEVEVDGKQPLLGDPHLELASLGGCGVPAGIRVSKKLSGGEGLVFENLAPGPWSAYLLADLGGARQTQVAFARVTIQSGETITLHLRLGGEVRSGRVTLRGRGVPARLNFQLRKERSRQDSVMSTATADEEGRFVCVLAGGAYRAEILPERPGVGAAVRSIDVDRRESTLEIRLPEGRIEGSVVDSQSRPQAGADITAFMVPEIPNGSDDDAGLTASSRALSDGQGAFALDGLVPGAWSLKATHGSRGSGAVLATVAADSTRSGVVLSLREKCSWSGVVRDSLLGVGRAADLLLTVCGTGESGIPTSASSRSGPDGTFTVSLPCEGKAGSVDMANLEILNGATAVTSRRIAASGPNEITVPVQGGDVIVRGLVSEAVVRQPYSSVLLRQDGSWVTIAALVQAGRGKLDKDPSPALSISGLEPGRWRLVACSTVAEAQVLVSGAGGALAALVEFDVNPGQVVEIGAPHH